MEALSFDIVEDGGICREELRNAREDNALAAKVGGPLFKKSEFKGSRGLNKVMKKKDG